MVLEDCTVHNLSASIYFWTDTSSTIKYAHQVLRNHQLYETTTDDGNLHLTAKYTTPLT